MATYQVLVKGVVRMEFSADFAQASSPILLNGKSTPFQVADAKHSPHKAATLLNNWCHGEGGAAWGDDENIEVNEVGGGDE